MDKIIIDGRIVLLDEWCAEKALDNLEKAPDGNILVAVSFGEKLVVRWIDEIASNNIIPNRNKEIRSKSSKASRKSCPWLFLEVENQFDFVASMNKESLEELHSNFNDQLELSGKNPESFRRWFSKIKKHWVKTVISEGKRIDNFETLVVYP